MKKHTLAITVENKPGVLTRVATMFRRRGYNIESLAVGETENPSVSRMTVVVSGDDKIIEQVSKQLYKLVDVIKVVDITEERLVERELILIKVKADPSVRSEIVQLVEIRLGIPLHSGIPIIKYIVYPADKGCQLCFLLPINLTFYIFCSV
jgi:acetolactate synthase-1/3 small subunit